MGRFSVKCRRKPSHEKTFDSIGIHVLMIALFRVFTHFDDCAFSVFATFDDCAFSKMRENRTIY